jgi:hypothetical protein
MYYFCTCFDKNYSTRGLALFDSLRTQTTDFRLFALCLDDEALAVVSQISTRSPKIVPVSLARLEEWNPELLKAKSNRSLIEYYFTLSPALPLFILRQYEEVDIITYLDADLYFYSDPAIIYKELGDNSILVIEHRYSGPLADLAVYGRFNVQYQSFRNDQTGLACLQRWHEQCLEWCYDRLEGGRFADQLYLDEWPELYSNLVISQLKGAGVAPWNVGSSNLKIEDDQYFVDGERLIFYHFHHLKYVFSGMYSNDFSNYHISSAQPNLSALYKDYLNALNRTQSQFGVPQYHKSRYKGRSSYPAILQIAKIILKGNFILEP